jgi:hypothetical protein
MVNKYISNNDFIDIKDTLSSLNKTNKNPKKNIVYEHIEPQLSILHRQYIYKAANKMAKQDPDLHERTFFIISIIYSMNLKLIDLIPIEEKHTIKMNNFFCDNNNNWWFKYIKEQNKLQYLPVNNETLESLKRWRKYLGLGPLPTPQDDKPLFLKKIIGGYRSSLSSRIYISKIINNCLIQASNFLLNDKFNKESILLKEIASRSLKSSEYEKKYFLWRTKF